MSNPISVAQLTELERTVQSKRLRFRLFDVRNGDDIQRAFAAPNTGYDAITVGLEAVTQAHSKKCLPSLLRNYRLPAIYGGREFVDAGGLMFYGLSFPEIYHRAATYVDKICTAWRA